MQVGTVKEIWRYPVKSMGGELRESAHVATGGIPGDRGWAVRDETAGEIRGAKRMPKLLMCEASYLSEPNEGASSPIHITLPDGDRITSDDPAAGARISEAVGRVVTLWPLQEDEDHYRSGKPEGGDPLADVRKILGLEEGEPFPDFSRWPTRTRGFATWPGTYFDLAPLHLLTTGALEEMARHNPEADWDRRRFRPNLLIETTGAEGDVPEFGWDGKVLGIGSTRISVMMPTVRCAMPTHPQPGLGHDPKVLRTLVRETGQFLGVYATVLEPGDVRVGDAVTLEDA